MRDDDRLRCANCERLFDPADPAADPGGYECPACWAGEPALPPLEGMPAEVVGVAVMHGSAAAAAIAAGVALAANSAEPQFVAIAGGLALSAGALCGTTFVRHPAVGVVHTVWGILAITVGALLFLLGIPFLLCWLVGLIPMAAGAAVLFYGVTVVVLTARSGFRRWGG